MINVFIFSKLFFKGSLGLEIVAIGVVLKHLFTIDLKVPVTY